MSREEVYSLIDGERDYQDRVVHMDPQRTAHPEEGYSVGDHITLLSRYVTKLQEAWTDNPGDQKALDVMRKCAAIAVRCMEEHGAPPRIYPLVPKTFAEKN